MITAKKILTIQKVSLLCSVIAMTLSVIAIVSISTKCDLNMKIIKENKAFKPIDKVPDVEIIHPDGRVEAVKSMESQDKLVDIIEPKKAVNSKKPEPISRNNAKNDKNGKNNNKKEQQSSKDVKVSQNNNNKIDDKNIKNNQTNTNNNQKQEEKKAINGNFIVQIGSFKDKKLAGVQCEKVVKTGKTKDKNCAISSQDNTFRSIVYPFKDIEEATAFANKLQRENRISCLVRKNK